MGRYLLSRLLMLVYLRVQFLEQLSYFCTIMIFLVTVFVKFLFLQIVLLSKYDQVSDFYQHVEMGAELQSRS